MPLPVVPDAMKVTFRATLEHSSGPVEEAQFGFTGVRVHRTGNPTDWKADVQQLAEKVRDKWIERVTQKGFWSAAVRMATVRVDHLNAADGKTQDVGIAPFVGAGNEWYGSGADSLPWETTMAVSLYGYGAGEFVLNKARKRGRMYLPPMAILAASGYAGQMTQGNLNNLTANMVAFFNDVQGAEFDSGSPEQEADYFDLRILSRGTQLKPLDPSSTPVTRIRLDSRIDSQRRRERQQPILAFAEGAVEHS